jgi:hypothetical protein
MLKKIQNLPEDKKKAILWILMVAACAIFAFFFVRITRKNFEVLDMGKIKEGLNFPEIKFPSINLDLSFPTSTIPSQTTSTPSTSTEEE